MAIGRFAPSPTGDLHLGNLRTALVAWLFARSAGSRFAVRMEDLDRAQSSPEHEASQLRDLAALGLDFDGPILRQSERFAVYEEAIASLDRRGLTYPCYCSRREIREAASAPHAADLPSGAYPGTCRDLTDVERREREQAGRPPALRLRAAVGSVTVVDDLLGPITAAVDDVVLRRNDGVPAYNLAVLVDDAAQGIEQVVRAEDLTSSSPRQAHLAELLALPSVRYAHVGLVLAPDGRRLAKRDGAVTLADQAALGRDADEVLSLLAASLDLAAPGEPVKAADLLERFAPARIPSGSWTLSADLIAPSAPLTGPPGPRSASRRGEGVDLSKVAPVASARSVPTTPERTAMPEPEDVVVVLAAHGSRAEAGNDSHRALAARLAETSGRTVLAAFLELAEPSIGAAISAAAGDANAVVVLPYFLHPGRHVNEDIPAIVEEARGRHPATDITLLGAFGGNDEVLDLLAAQLRRA